MTKKLLSLKDIYNLDITEIKSYHSDFLNTNQSKMLSKFSYAKDKFVKADGVYLYTDSGKKILDFSGGIGVLNHGHNNLPLHFLFLKCCISTFRNKIFSYYNPWGIRIK